MRKMIDGKVYNTETATWFVSWENDAPRNDFKFFAEALYKTPRGRFFLHGRGGPMSPYATINGVNCVIGGENILPLSESEARAWLEKRDLIDVYEAIFGHVEEA